MSRKYSFSLYENNEKDNALIQLLEILPKHLRGKFIRSMLLKAIDNKVFESVGFLKMETVSEDRKEDTTQNQKFVENTTKSETKKTYSKNNPFEGLKL